MKSYILAGGFGTRFAEMTDVIPKPMIPIGKWPILLHIMSHYASFGIKDFVVLAGYKAVAISDFFSRGEGLTKCLENSWKVEVVDTGLNTTTAGRLWFVRESLPETFMLTYGDGLSDIDLNKLYQAHQSSKLTATVTAVHPPARFGTIEFESGVATSFEEKNPQRTGWINGGFFVLRPSVIDRISDDLTVWEREPLEALANDGQIKLWFHKGFWQPMDTLRDKQMLEALWASGSSPWKVWE